MPDRFLIGNGYFCEICFPDQPVTASAWKRWNGRPWDDRRGCNGCAGWGRIGYSAEHLIAEAVAAKAAARQPRP